MSETDLELLERYVRQEAEDAFAEIVHRYLNLVYSAALRQAIRPPLAEEISQSVFLKLSRAAGRLRPGTVLGAWLYQVTRREAIDVVRREARRALREHVATEIESMKATASDWTQIGPMLDEAMETLNAIDRTAILLRYFENKSLREVGAALGSSEDAAQKRVSRALESLRAFFSKNGLSVSTGSLALILSANSVQAAPAGLALALSTAVALASPALPASFAVVTTKTLVMHTLTKTAIAVALTVAVGTGIYQNHRASVAQRQLRLFEDQQASLTEQLQRAQKEREFARNRLAAFTDELAKGTGGDTEVFKLRGEIGVLRRQLAEAHPTNVVAPVQPAPADWPQDPAEQTKRIARDKSIDGRNHSLHFAMFASDNQGWFPTNWQQMARYEKDFPVSGTNEFELIYRTPLNQSQLGTNLGTTALVREYLAWPTPDGKWGKIYGFADGHSESVILPDGDFDNWEKQHTFDPRAAEKATAPGAR